MPKNLAQTWREGLLVTAAAKKEKEKEGELRRADTVIKKIPKLVTDAIKKGSETFRATRCHLKEADLRESGRKREGGGLSKLADKPVSPEDFSSVWCQLVVKWCNENGLECFLEKRPGQDRGDSDNYFLSVRIKTSTSDD